MTLPALPLNLSPGSKLWSNTGILQYFSEDGNQYCLGHCDAVVITAQTIDSTSGVTVTTLQFNVNPAWYMVEGVIYWQQGTTADGQNFWFNGPAASFVAVSYDFIECSTSGETAFSGVATKIGSSGGASMPSTGYGGSTHIKLEIHGPILFTAAGTFGLTAGNGTSGATMVIAAGAWMSIRPTINQAA